MISGFRISGFRNRPHLLRDAQGSGLVEAFVIIGIVTILLTRAYLHLTGYPQVGVPRCTSRTSCGADSAWSWRW